MFEHVDVGLFEKIGWFDFQVAHELVCDGFTGLMILIVTENDLEFEEKAEVAYFVDVDAGLAHDRDLTFLLDDAANTERTREGLFASCNLGDWRKQIVR